MPSPPSEADLIARVVDRLRRDHPDPKLRAQLDADGKLPDYVRALLQDEPSADIERIVSAVRAAEDGQPGPMAAGE